VWLALFFLNSFAAIEREVAVFSKNVAFSVPLFMRPAVLALIAPWHLAGVVIA
jgi:hypothetical protein